MENHLAIPDKTAKEDLASQLHDLASNDMLQAMFPNLNTLANICLTIPVATASVERSFSYMKMIKTRFRNGGKVFISYDENLNTIPRKTQ